jgi:ABC-type branched-subunit amino acid transport system ATPase component
MTEATGRVKLEVRGLTAGYGAQPVVFEINASFRSDTITALIGPNGAGKSTLLKAIFGLAKVFHGTICLDGNDSSGASARTLVKSGVAYVPQSGNIFPSLSVRENLAIGGYVRKGGSLERALSIFPELTGMMNRRAGKLSGGQRVMVAVARALMSDPRVLLLDEATAGLSPMSSRLLWSHIVELTKQGVAVVAVEQNVKLALTFAQDVYVLASGRNRLQGSAAELALLENWDEVFLTS